MKWFFLALKKYAVFSGRAPRKEYWYFILFSTIILILLTILDELLGTYSYFLGPEEPIGIINGIYSLLILMPLYAVLVRRLHDVGRSGWWLVWSIIPLIVLLIIGAMLPDDKVSELESIINNYSIYQDNYGDSVVLQEEVINQKNEDANIKVIYYILIIGGMLFFVFELFMSLAISYFSFKKSQPGRNKYGPNPLHK